MCIKVKLAAKSGVALFCDWARKQSAAQENETSDLISHAGVLLPEERG
jgi:hypothetical protein